MSRRMTADSELLYDQLRRGWAERFKERLATLGVTQADVARSLGVDANQVSRWCRGEHLPQIATRLAIARELATTDKWMLYGDECS